MTLFIYNLNSSGVCAAVTAAEEGIDVVACEPTYRLGQTSASGLGQLDREGTLLPPFKTRELRWGFMLDLFKKRFDNDDYPFVPMELWYSELVKALNEYSVRKKKADGTETGRIIWRLNAPLEAVLRTGNLITGVKCGGVTYTAFNFIDASDELDLAKMAKISLILGRESSKYAGEPTAGGRIPVVSRVRGYLPNGERRPGLECRSAQGVNDADTRIQAFNMRVMVTDHATRINWADVDVDSKASDYDLDFEAALSENRFEIPGSIGRAMRPTGEVPQYDMNNGGGIKYGTDWNGKLFDWHNSTWDEREEMRFAYMNYKLGLFKDICTNPRWLTIPPKVYDDGTSVQIVSDTKRWGLVPGVFVEPSWQADTDVKVDVVRAKGKMLYICVKAGKTAAAGGPTGKGTSILDGAAATDPTDPTTEKGARWKWLRYYIPGMSPHMYIRESFRLKAQETLEFADSLYEHDVAEPLTLYGYPHIDSHLVQTFAGENGMMAWEGANDLDNGQEIQIVALPFGCIKPLYDECKNLLVVRGIGATRMGWMDCRIEMSWMKIGQAAALVAAGAELAGLYTGDADYRAHVLPRLIANKAVIYFPKAA